MGFKGSVWPVHPTKAEIGGLKAYPSLADLPEAPDATFIGVNRFATIDVVAELAAMGAGGAICFASGWTEAGEPGLQDRLVAAAGEMPILGPNCYGVINYLDGALLWPDQHGGIPVDKGIALVSQSSNIVINLGMQQRGLPVAYVACLGNAAVVGLAELTGALLDDPRVTAVGLYIEGIDDAPAFAALGLAHCVIGRGRRGVFGLPAADRGGGGGYAVGTGRDAKDLPCAWASDRDADLFLVLLGRGGGAGGGPGGALRDRLPARAAGHPRPAFCRAGGDPNDQQPP